ncbi:hypothetical protein MKEN_00762100 [Mycena kentingensis (nom. inval.)]|nr:hypothetical protein MKEN_00762100 [Mycena kentingensis (nom. inval.)]
MPPRRALVVQHASAPAPRPKAPAKAPAPPKLYRWTTVKTTLSSNTAVGASEARQSVSPRIWTGSQEEFFAILPELGDKHGVASKQIEQPAVFLKSTDTAGMSVAAVSHDIISLKLTRRFSPTKKFKADAGVPASVNSNGAESTAAMEVDQPAPAVRQVPHPLPPEIEALIDAFVNIKPVLCIATKECIAELWNAALPDEAAVAYLGFYAILSVTETCTPVSVEGVGQVEWRFILKWEQGGEEHLGFSEAPPTRPWWCPNPQQSQSPPVNIPASTEIYAAQQRASANFPFINVPLRARCPSLLPFHLLVDPHAGDFHGAAEDRCGWLCTACGRLNRDMAMRHRSCRSARCAATAVAQSGYSIPLDRIRTPHDALPQREPYYKGLARPADEEFADGMRVFRWRIDGGPALTSVFAGNSASLQRDATDLLVRIQRECELVRASFGSLYFEYSSDAPDDWPDCLRSATAHISTRLEEYAGIRGSVESISVRGWVEKGMLRQTPETLPVHGYAAILCLGKDVELEFIRKTSGRKKVAEFSLRLAHGDILVLEKGSLEYLIGRDGTSILVMVAGERDT